MQDVTVCHVHQHSDVFHLAGRAAENKWQAWLLPLSRVTHTQSSHTYLTLSPLHHDKDVIWLTIAGVAEGGNNRGSVSSGWRARKRGDLSYYWKSPEVSLWQGNNEKHSISTANI